MNVTTWYAEEKGMSTKDIRDMVDRVHAYRVHSPTACDGCNDGRM